MSFGRTRKQTVKQAIDTSTGTLLDASALLAMSQEQFTLLRRRTLEARVHRSRHGSDEVALVCACCKHPLYLSRHQDADGPRNRWFVHDGHTPPECVYHEGSRHSEETTRALIYRGQQESDEHREMKRFLSDWLRRDPDVDPSSVETEKTKFSAVIAGEWRRPDVRCLYRGTPVVFEIQLTYTFLTTVIERDEFYRREGEFIIWVFQAFDRSRAAVTDEAFFNRRNLFVLDTEAMNATAERGLLTFSGYHQEPRAIADRIEDVWSNKLIGLRETIFPADTCRPFYFDYPAASTALQAKRAQAREQALAARWNGLVQAYLNAVLEYFESGHGKDREAQLLAVVAEMYDCPQWHRGFEVLKHWLMYGKRGILAVLLSMKFNKVVSYRPSNTVFQVLNAGLQKSEPGLKHPYTVMFLRAYKKWRPPMSEKHRHWVADHARGVKASLYAGEETYCRSLAYDEAVGLLFPELDEALSDLFGAVVHMR